MREDDMRTLITRAGLDIQHKCSGCGCLLMAYGRKPSDNWSCPQCKVPGKNIAIKYEESHAN